MPRILIADSLAPAGVELLRESAEVDQLRDKDRPRLPELIADYDAVIVRSGTEITREVLEGGDRLKVVGRAGVGVDNIDLAAATQRGVLVINAPTANSLSATEHTFALLLALARRIPSADASLKAERWERKNHVGSELQGKTLGVIGFGQIGQRVATRARAFEMETLAFDPFLQEEVARRLDVEPVALEDLLARSDFITFHTPLTDQTRNMLDESRIALMKDGAAVINVGRGGVVDAEALLAALESGKLAGAGLDVFPVEPPTDFRLAAHPKVVATPHIGAQTTEAQDRIATETARMVLAALRGSLAVSAVNLPFRSSGSRGEPFLRLGEQLGRLAAVALGGSLRRVQVDLWGIDEELQRSVAVAALKGALIPSCGEGVNYVNAERTAADRRVELVQATHSDQASYAHGAEPAAGAWVADGVAEASGTTYRHGEIHGDLRVVSFAGFQLEFQPRGRLLFLRNRDVPGFVGRLGTLLGDAGINIADIHLSREPGGDALAVLRTTPACGRCWPSTR
ncbi:MAG: phosphoglycerate dehydrogenase [Acidobacteria bacterium]|nr:phosphoglycerate dehydrogenase [Acidobacteriota bacterium]